MSDESVTLNGSNATPNPGVLSPSDARSVVAMVRELHDPALTFVQRCQVLARSLCELTGSLRCLVAEVDVSRAPWPYDVHIHGDHSHLDDSDIRFLHTCLADSEAVDRIAGAAASQHDRTITLSARQAFGENVWSGSTLYDRYFRPLGIHDLLHSRSSVSVRSGWTGWIAMTRRAEDGAYAEREAAIVEAVHAELGPWLWRQLADQYRSDTMAAGGSNGAGSEEHIGDGLHRHSAHAAMVARLSGAERRILPLLLSGRTEVQIAELVHRSKHTVHDHAKRIYATMGVSSRVELVLMFTRMGREGGRGTNGPTGLNL